MAKNQRKVEENEKENFAMDWGYGCGGELEKILLESFWKYTQK